jgi:hypothetical protein
MTVFAAASLLASAGVIGALAVGERWTSPLLIGWAVVAEFTAFLAFCLVANAAAGFIARPPRTRARRAAESGAVAGGAAVQAAIAFHDPLWHLMRGSPLTSVPGLAVLTLSPGAVAALAAAGFVLLRADPRPASEPGPPAAPLPGRTAATCSRLRKGA